jgi:hypothetical protein
VENMRLTSYEFQRIMYARPTKFAQCLSFGNG